MSVLENSPFHLPEQPAETELVAKYFRGLGDATRLRILELLLAHEELSVGELVERLSEPQPKVSNHLACLRWCGFVATRREHRMVNYRVSDERVAAIVALAHDLLADNEEHVAACCRIDSPGGRGASNLSTRKRSRRVAKARVSRSRNRRSRA